ncbi:MAG: hypothetical protein WBA73_03395 [Devosia sp.]
MFAIAGHESAVGEVSHAQANNRLSRPKPENPLEAWNASRHFALSFIRRDPTRLSRENRRKIHGFLTEIAAPFFFWTSYRTCQYGVCVVRTPGLGLTIKVQTHVGRKTTGIRALLGRIAK